MTFTLYPELCKKGEFPENELYAELVESAIDDYLTYGDCYGECYNAIIALCLAGF